MGHAECCNVNNTYFCGLQIIGLYHHVRQLCNSEQLLLLFEAVGSLLNFSGEDKLAARITQERRLLIKASFPRLSNRHYGPIHNFHGRYFPKFRLFLMPDHKLLKHSKRTDQQNAIQNIPDEFSSIIWVEHVYIIWISKQRPIM